MFKIRKTNLTGPAPTCSKRSRRSRAQGFTLIELLVVIAIIGILSTVGLTNLNSARLKARDAARHSDVSQTRLLLELYYDDNEEYFPANCSDNAPTVAGWTGLMAEFVAADYIDSALVDPKNSGDYVYKYCVDAEGKYRISYKTEVDEEVHTIGY